MNFLADRWVGTYPEPTDVHRAKECLFAVIKASAAPACTVAGKRAAANAATVLNWMGEPMIRQQWDGVYLNGADLTRAVLIGTTLRGASLKKCRLERAQVRILALICRPPVAGSRWENGWATTWASGLSFIWFRLAESLDL